jgi:ABC-type uncharacterized transport system ATPase subunit
VLRGTASSLLRLSAERDRLAGLLSHGQKQFLEIGMLLVQLPSAAMPCTVVKMA